MIRIYLCLSRVFVMSCSEEQDPEIPKNLEELGIRLMAVESELAATKESLAAAEEKITALESAGFLTEETDPVASVAGYLTSYTETDPVASAAGYASGSSVTANTTAIALNTVKVSFPGFGTASGTALEGDTNLGTQPRAG